jgi:hypothetical protein
VSPVDIVIQEGEVGIFLGLHVELDVSVNAVETIQEVSDFCSMGLYH